MVTADTEATIDIEATVQGVQAVQFCPDCESEHLGVGGEDPEPCPLCPLAMDLHVADDEVRATRRYRVLSTSSLHRFECGLNERTCSGWTLQHFRVGSSTHEDDENGAINLPEYVAIFVRDEFDAIRHREAVEAKLHAEAVYQALRRAAEKAVEAFRAEGES